ncbi:zf-HC2 domain-containing protein [Streptomyces sp. G-G2]|uniref:zf-HC2 domain-containing protein n=1 Tax=Streptomyces sp. G-G2 TaxID=3046201 RepID=UPI0024B8CC60|nr:zf-HC2 domain-containing protein [Streptomyces sp. G-G2]MDJ0380028.1 zf-HC2 domain-containing protein [Streptomyces sp. G-G2]
MNREVHEEELLGPYVLGVLDDGEARRVEEHMSGCVRCREEVAALREMEAALGEVPEEAFLEGPPQGGDLLLQRTLRQMRSEREAAARRRTGVVGLVAAAALAGVFWAGTALAGPDAGPVAQGPPPTPTVSAQPSPPPVGVRVASATDAGTGARATVQLTPAATWVRLHAAVTGIPAGERCLLVVVARDGTRTTAGSWVVGSQENGSGKGAALDGSAAVDPGQVKEIVVQNEAGTSFVTVPLAA